MIKKYLFCILLVLFGCSGDKLTKISDGGAEVADLNVPHYQVFVDSTFTVNHKVDIAAAFEEWNAKTNNITQFDIHFFQYSKMPNVRKNAIFVYSKELIPVVPNTRVLGMTYPNKNDNFARIDMLSGLDDDVVFTTAMIHEIGHALGLNHYTGNNPSIMHPMMSLTTRIECRDLKLFCDLWNCTVDCDPAISNIDNPGLQIRSDGFDCLIGD